MNKVLAGSTASRVSGWPVVCQILWVIIAASFATLPTPARAVDTVLITVLGDEATLQPLLEAASLALAAKNKDAVNTQDILAAARADYGRMLGVLYSHAYYSGTISIRIDGREAFDIPPFSPPAVISEITIQIETGPSFTFRQTEVAPLADNTDLPENFAPGRLANSTAISDAAAAAVLGWRKVGHAKADIRDQQVVADHRMSELEARLRVDPGPKLTFGQLILSQPGAVREERVRAIAGFPAGELYSPDELDTVVRRLRRTGAFKAVTLTESDTIGSGQTLDVELALVDQLPRRFGLGAEISTIEGASLTGYWMHRNLLGGAENLRFDSSIQNIGGNPAATGGIDYLLGVRLTRPASYGPDTSFSLFANAEIEDEPVYFKKSAEGGVEAWRIFSDQFEATLGFGFRYAEFDDDLGDRSFLHLTLPATATWDQRDDALAPQGGFFVTGQALPYVGLNDTASGARFFVDGRYYQGLAKGDRLVLATRLQMGSVVGSSLIGTAPDYLFLSGGGGSVRGQGYQSLFLTLSGGAEIGGRSFLGASLELRGKISKSIGLVGFYDYGFIGPDSLPGADGDWHSGAGIGLRYDTGIGPLRFDIAVPVHGSSSAGSYAIYVGIGQAF